MIRQAISALPVKALAALAIVLGTAVNTPRMAKADEGGVSFWLPGFYGSLAAVPQQPGWSLPLVYYHTSVSASGSVGAAREVQIGRFSPTVKLNLDVNVNADVDLGIIVPTYVFPSTVFGGQLAVGMMFVTGANHTTLDGTLSASLGPLFASRSGSIDSSVTGFGDLFPNASLRWNSGVNNVMIYMTGNIPVGDYNPNRLANLGLGHAAVDGGVGYTYLNPKSGFEASVVTGLTGNFENPDTNYTNGIDWHTDWGVSQFLSKQFFIGAVGYVYNQITADSGQAAFLGSNMSRVYGVGPQLGYIFPINEQTQGYLNLKGYYEFDSTRRPDGWNVWVTFVISPAAAPPPAATAMRHR